MRRNSGFERKDRVASEIKKAISQILEVESGNENLKSITLTGVEVSQDLRIAKIYVSSSLSEMTEETTLNTLNNALGFIKRNLAKMIRLKYMPKLIFEYDTSIDYGFRIDKVLKEIKKRNETNNK